MAKFCSNCGAELNDNQDVCLKCGVRVTKEIVVSTKSTEDTKALVGFILGLVSIVAWFLPLIGYPTAICGIVFSAKGLKSTSSKGKATAGLVLSIIFLVFTIINSIVGVMNNLDYYY